MAKGAYIGVGGVARKIKKSYIGVEGVARKIKKAYIGIGGVARPCWGGGEPVYYGTITPLSAARYGLAATTVGSYALFGGGRNGNNYYDTVDAYNSSLTRSTPTALSLARMYLAATTVGSYALFGGGHISNAYGETTVDAYNSSLTRSTPTALSKKRYSLAATTIGGYALFSGGSYMSGQIYYSADVDAYNSSLTRSTPTALSVGRKNLRATTIGNYALFGGGSGGDYVGTVDAYNTSLTRSTPTALSFTKECSATRNNKYAIFATDTNVDAYDVSLTKITTSNGLYINGTSHENGATMLGNYAIFACSLYDWETSGILKETAAYDEAITKVELEPFSGAVTNATTLGNYALFGGGRIPINMIGFNTVDIVEAYTIA